MLSSRLVRLSGAFLLGLAWLGAAQATSLKLDETLDLTQPLAAGVNKAGQQFGVYQGTPAFSAPASLTLDVGDQLTYTAMFKPNQSLSLQNVQYIWGYVGSSSPGTTVNETGQLQLLNADGSVMLTSKVRTFSESSNTFGEAFVAADFAGSLPPTTTFAGIRYVGTVDSYSGGTTSRLYDSPGFAWVASTGTIGTTPAVPEPASVAMLLAGLGLLAGTRLKRRGR